MTERIKKLAQEANAYAISINPKDGDEFETAFEQKFADLIRADEREACAKWFEGLYDHPHMRQYAAAIRARKTP